MMAGIAGIKKSGQKELVNKMLDKLSHRGKAGRKIIETDNATIGVVWSIPQKDFAFGASEKICVQDYAGNGHIAKAEIADGKLLLRRDELGIAPLYFGKDNSNSLCFASEVKSLLEATKDINEFLPGYSSEDEVESQYFQLRKKRK